MIVGNLIYAIFSPKIWIYFVFNYDPFYFVFFRVRPFLYHIIYISLTNLRFYLSCKIKIYYDTNFTIYTRDSRDTDDSSFYTNYLVLLVSYSVPSYLFCFCFFISFLLYKFYVHNVRIKYRQY